MREFYEGFAEIIEVDVAKIAPDLNLEDYAWDSLAIVSTIALIDDLFNKMVNGQSLAKCQTLSDIVLLIENAKQD